MVFSFDGVRNGFLRGNNSISMTDMMNRKVYNAGNGSQTAVISSSGAISLSFSSGWTAAIPDNREIYLGRYYANQTLTIPSSGYNSGYFKISGQYRVNTDNRINGIMYRVTRNTITVFELAAYHDEESGEVTDHHRGTTSVIPWNLTGLVGDTIYFSQVESGINNLYFDVYYLPTTSTGSDDFKRYNFFGDYYQNI